MEKLVQNVFDHERVFSGVWRAEISATCKNKKNPPTMSRTPPNLMDVLQIAKKLEGPPPKKKPPLFFGGGGS